jgi:hypothetical protein
LEAIGHNCRRPLAASKEDADAIVAAAEAAVSIFAIPMRFFCVFNKIPLSIATPDFHS